jgi:hypothetical protein
MIHLHTTYMHVTASLDLLECKQLLTVSIPQQHTAHADQRHARESSGVC